MNEEIFKEQAELCRVFTHPTRIQILEILSKGERNVGEMTEASGVPQPTLSRHLALLRSRGVVQTRREGTCVYYSLADPRILEACRLMRSVLMERLRKQGRKARAGRGRSGE